MARTSSALLNKTGESGHPCLVPDLKGNTFSFCPLSMMLAVGLSYMAFIMLCSLYSHFAESFYHKWVLDFVKCFFIIYWCDHVIFIFHFVCVVYRIYWFLDIVPTLHPNPTWPCRMIFGMCCWVWFASILLRILAHMLIWDIGLWSSFFVGSSSGCGVRVANLIKGTWEPPLLLNFLESFEKERC